MPRVVGYYKDCDRCPRSFESTFQALLTFTQQNLHLVNLATVQKRKNTVIQITWEGTSRYQEGFTQEGFTNAPSVQTPRRFMCLIVLDDVRCLV